LDQKKRKFIRICFFLKTVNGMEGRLKCQTFQNCDIKRVNSNEESKSQKTKSGEIQFPNAIHCWGRHDKRSLKSGNRLLLL